MSSSKSTSDPRTVSPGTKILAGMTNYLVEREFVKLPRQKSKQTILDEELAQVESRRPAGIRDATDEEWFRHDEIGAIAMSLDPTSRYRETHAPTIEELPALTHYRFRHLENFAESSERSLRTTQTPEMELACAVCRHPSLQALQAAFECVYANSPSRKGISKGAAFYSWNRDLRGLRNLLAGKPFQATAKFAELYPTLIADKGDFEAVCFVLDQAYELERFVEYVGGGLTELRSLPMGDAVSKGQHYGDLSPNLVYTATETPGLINKGNWQQHSQLSVDAMKGVRLANHSISAPEGDRWHGLLGHTPLNFILHYLFETEKRFRPYIRGPTQPGRRASNSKARPPIIHMSQKRRDRLRHEGLATISSSGRLTLSLTLPFTSAATTARTTSSARGHLSPRPI